MNNRQTLIASLLLLASCHVSAQTHVRKSKSAINDVQEVPEVVVTGTGTSNLLKNSPVQTEVITRKMIESYGGKSIEEILGGLTASFSFNEGDMGSQMQLNGLGNNYILILIDGKRIHGDVGGENDLGLIDPHNIERIEVVKGAQSALYGSDAMAGVINIITRKHDTQGVLLENTTHYGSHNDVRQHNSVGLRFGKLQSVTGFQLQHTDGWQNTGDEYTEAKVVHDSRSMTVNKYTNWQVSERLTYDFSKRFSMYADGSYYTKLISRPTDGKYASCDVYTYDLMYRNASASLGGKWLLGARRKSSENSGKGSSANGDRQQDYLSFDVDWNKHAYYYKYTARTYEYMRLEGEEYGEQEGEWFSVPYYAGQKKLQSDQQRLMAQGKAVLHLPYANTLNTGIEWRYDYLNAPQRTETGTASDWTGAVYAQNEFNLVPWMNITAGLRLIDNKNCGLHFTPKLSTMFSTGDFRFRLGWSQGFKTPTVKELYYRYLHVMGSSTFFNLGNTSLKPQTSNYYSANAEYRNSRLTLSLTGYYNRLANMITLVNVDVSEIPVGITDAYLGDGSGKVQARMYKNAESARTYGIDFNASYKITPELTVNGSYAYLDTEADVYNTSKNRLESVTIDGMAHHKWSASLIYGRQLTPGYRLGANLSTRGSSKRYYQNNGDGKAFQIWRLNTTHDFSGSARKSAARSLTYRLEVGVDNIFNFRDTTMRPYHLGNTTSGTTVYGTFAIRFNSGKKITKQPQPLPTSPRGEEE